MSYKRDPHIKDILLNNPVNTEKCPFARHVTFSNSTTSLYKMRVRPTTERTDHCADVGDCRDFKQKLKALYVPSYQILNH